MVFDAVVVEVAEVPLKLTEEVEQVSVEGRGDICVCKDYMSLLEEMGSVECGAVDVDKKTAAPTTDVSHKRDR